MLLTANTINPKLHHLLSNQWYPNIPFLPPFIDTNLLNTFYGNHVAAITGAGSGIGRALALVLAEAGCHLALADINADRLDETRQQLGDSQVKITTTVLDVSKKEAVNYWAGSVVEQHGQVNFIFNNAGVALSSCVEGMTMEELAWVMDINFWGVVHGTQAFLPLIKRSVQLSKTMPQSQATTKASNGHIINISSLFGLTAVPTQAAYNASKFAVRGFSECLRQELAIQNCGVSLTCIHPGGIKTNIANQARTNDNVTTLGLKVGPKSLAEINKLLKLEPKSAAKIIVMAAANNQARCLVGDDAKMVDLVQRLFPGDYARVLHKAAHFAKRVQKKRHK